MSETIYSTHDAASAIAKLRAGQQGEETDSQEEIEAPEGGAPEPEDEDPPVSGDHEEEGEPEVTEPPAIAAPTSWPKDRLEEWESLPDTAKEQILRREEEIQSAISEKGREAAEARRKAEEAASRKAQEYEQRISRLDPLIASLEQRAESKYKGVDWVALSKEDPERFVQLKAEYDADNDAYQKARRERDQARAETEREFQQSEFQKLLDRNPQYRGEEGKKKLAEEAREVESFARSLEGVTDDYIRMMPADVYEALRDANAYRKAKKTATQPAKQPPQKSVKPSARPAPSETAKKSYEEARKRALKTSRESGRNQADRALADLIALKRQKA